VLVLPAAAHACDGLHMLPVTPERTVLGLQKQGCLRSWRTVLVFSGLCLVWHVLMLCADGFCVFFDVVDAWSTHAYCVCLVLVCLGFHLGHVQSKCAAATAFILMCACSTRCFGR
jgi:hypothetical protein